MFELKLQLKSNAHGKEKDHGTRMKGNFVIWQSVSLQLDLLWKCTRRKPASRQDYNSGVHFIWKERAYEVELVNE